MYVYTYIMTTQTTTREQRARNLLANPNTHILRINDNHFQMKSLATNRIYDIMSKLHKWSCTCPDHKFRFVECKHIKAIKISIDLKQEIRKRNKVLSILFLLPSADSVTVQTSRNTELEKTSLEIFRDSSVLIATRHSQLT